MQQLQLAADPNAVYAAQPAVQPAVADPNAVYAAAQPAVQPAAADPNAVYAFAQPAVQQAAADPNAVYAAAQPAVQPAAADPNAVYAFAQPAVQPAAADPNVYAAAQPAVQTAAADPNAGYAAAQPALQPAIQPAVANPIALYQQAVQQYLALATQYQQAASIPGTDPMVAQQYMAMAAQYAQAATAAGAALPGLAVATSAIAPAATTAIVPAQPALLGDSKGKGKNGKGKNLDDPDRTLGIITKVDDSGDFGFCKFKHLSSQIFLHKQHYTSARHDQILEVGKMIQCKLFTNPSGKQSCTQAYEVDDAEATANLKNELGCEVLDDTTYTGWVVWLDVAKQHGKIRSQGLEEAWPNIKQEVKRGATVSKGRTKGLSTKMCCTFQIELNDKDQLLGRNVYVVSGTNPDECPFPIDDGGDMASAADRKGSKGKGKGKDDKGKGKGKDDKGKGKFKGKGFIVPAPPGQGGGADAGADQPLALPAPVQPGLIGVSTPNFVPFSGNTAKVDEGGGNAWGQTGNSWENGQTGNSWNNSWDNSWNNSQSENSWNNSYQPY